jgi:hypothetical protein
MSFLNRLLGRRAKIADWAGIEDFLDRHGAFLVNRTMYEYARARSGLNSEKLFREEMFKAAIEEGRWRAYPIALGYIAELVEGELRPPALAARRGEALVASLRASAEAVHRRYAPPADFPGGAWEEGIAEMGAKIGRLGLGPAKTAADIPIATFETFFGHVPLHPTVMKHDYEVVLNHVRSNMCNILDTFRAEADPRALVNALPGPP